MISAFESPSESMSGPERNRIHSPPDVATSAITWLRLAGMQRRAVSQARRVTAEARIRPLRPSDHARVIAVIDEWRSGRPMAQMLPRLFFDHFTDSSALTRGSGARD